MKKITLLFLVLPFLGLGQVQIGDNINGDNIEDFFGTDTSISSNGNIISIGALGYVRIYENQNGSWIQIGNDINGETLDDTFGQAISLSSDGSIVAIGAPQYIDSGSGYVRIYENQNGSWIQIGNDINGEAFGDTFGHVISLSSDGSIVAIGAKQNDTNGDGSGHVKIYENQNGSWIQIGNNINGDSIIDFFGNTISLSPDGNVVAIGARGLATPFGSYIKVFENQNGSWVQRGDDINGDTFNKLGDKVELSLNGNLLFASKNTNNGGSGSVQMYELNDLGNWELFNQEISYFAPPYNSDSYGYRISSNENASLIVVGAPLNDQYGIDSGLVQIFVNQNGNWIQLGQDIFGENEGDACGISIKISSDGSVIVVGSNRNSDNGTDSGHVRIFSIASELSLLEVVEDISGNLNGINITAEQLNRIIGVSGAIENVNYTTALQNGTFVDPNNPTAAEIQLIIDQVNDTLSISDSELSSFSLYPNPTKNQFTIQLTDRSILETVTIYNTLGQVVLTSNELVVNTSALASGSYIVEIKTNQGKASKKLIIE